MVLGRGSVVNARDALDDRDVAIATPCGPFIGLALGERPTQDVVAWADRAPTRAHDGRWTGGDAREIAARVRAGPDLVTSVAGDRELDTPRSVDRDGAARRRSRRACA